MVSVSLFFRKVVEKLDETLMEMNEPTPSKFLFSLGTFTILLVSSLFLFTIPPLSTFISIKESFKIISFTFLSTIIGVIIPSGLHTLTMKLVFDAQYLKNRKARKESN